ncbi:MAG TPA: SDR family oxidoreductase [Flavobacterium sp.]|nr:SDR family oxidoreductase [Flavobacterium sp.]
METNTYLIAGASSGIGLQLAKQLIAHGNRVIGMSRTPGELESHAHYRFVAHDFSTNAALPEITEPLAGLVYCPGSINLKGLQQIRETDITRDLQLNVVASFLFVQQYSSNLKEAVNPSVVLFSSVAATIGLPYHVVVSVSKAAVEGMTRALAAELAPRVRVNCIAPSLTDTPLAAQLLNSDAKRTANSDRHPLKKIGTVTDIANTALFLLRDAHWMTGQVLGINGGLGTIQK